jgi:hypothetical protein
MRSIGLCLLIICLALTACSHASHNAGPVHKLDSNISQALYLQGHTPWPGPARRKAYRFSVVNGGIYSSAELVFARRTDPVVGAHYAQFGKNVVFRVTTKNLYSYVSYRKNNCIYWSRTRHRIPKGELLLTDGEHLARTRCGNQLSDSPQKPTASGSEPTEADLNTSEAVSLPDIETSSVPGVDFYMPADSLPGSADLAPWRDGSVHNASLANGAPYGSPGAENAYAARPMGEFPIGDVAAQNYGPGGGYLIPTVVPIPSTPTPEPGSIELLLCVLPTAILLALFQKRARLR